MASTASGSQFRRQSSKKNIKYYRYVEPNGNPFTHAAKFKKSVRLSEEATAKDLITKVLKDDPPSTERSGKRGDAECKIFISDDALLKDEDLPEDQLLGDLSDEVGTASHPLLIVPHIYTKVEVRFKVMKPNGAFEMRGTVACNLVCDRLQELELNQIAAQLVAPDTIRGFVLVWKDGYRFRLQASKNGLYDCKIDTHHNHGDGLHIIIADNNYFGEKLNMSNKKLPDCLQCNMVQNGLILDVNDVLRVRDSTPPPNADISIDNFISAAERMIFCMMTFKGLPKEQHSRSIASTLQYVALLVVVKHTMDASTLNACGNKVRGEEVDADRDGGKGKDSVPQDSVCGDVGHSKQHAYACEEEDEVGKNANGSSGHHCSRGVANRSRGGSGELLDHAFGRTRNQTKSWHTEMEASSIGATEKVPTVTVLSPTLAKGEAMGRRLVIVEEMPIPPEAIIDTGGEFILMTGFIDYLVIHAAGEEEVDKLSSDAGLVVTEVKSVDTFSDRSSFEQLAVGGRAIQQVRKSQGRGISGDGGPMHLIKTDGIRWQCAKLVENAGKPPSVLLGKEVALRFYDCVWPLNVREIVNYLVKVYLESLKSSPCVSENSVILAGRASASTI